MFHVYLIYVFLVCSLQPCDLLLGKGWVFGALACCVLYLFCDFPIRFGTWLYRLLIFAFHSTYVYILWRNPVSIQVFVRRYLQIYSYFDSIFCKQTVNIHLIQSWLGLHCLHILFAVVIPWFVRLYVNYLTNKLRNIFHVKVSNLRYRWYTSHKGPLRLQGI